MIVVTIQLHSAITGKVTNLGRMVISNDGTSTDKRRGNYDVRLAHKTRQQIKEIFESPRKMARIEDYPRLAYDVWELVRRALNKLSTGRSEI